MSILGRFKKNEKGDEKKSIKNKKKTKNLTKKEKKVKARTESSAYKILSHPLISEKATYLNEENKYVFIVSKKSNKKDIKQAIKDVYGVVPVSVRTINVIGKKRRYGRALGKTSDYKKAIVKLSKGDSIQIYEGV